MSNNFLENIFSIKNDENKKHKVITVCGIKLKIKRFSLKKAIEEYKINNDKSLEIEIPDNLALQLMFNNDCNCKCKFCFAEGATTKNTQIMSESYLYKYLLPLYEKTNNIIPTDGEITFHKEGYEYLSFINKNYPQINVFVETNGIAFDKKWQELAAENLMRVNFSLNAINEEYFKKTVWDKDGVHSTVINNLNNYIKTLDEKGIGVFRPSVSCVLNSSNYETVEKFIINALKLNIQNIIFFFDATENNLYDEKNPIADIDGFTSAYKTLTEINKILENKVNLGYKLFFPNGDFDRFEKQIQETNIETIKIKHPEIVKLSENLPTLKSLYLQKNRLRQLKNKKEYSFYEELTNVCYHQFNNSDKIICKNAWNHIRLMPDGRASICSWRPYDMNINNFLKNDTVDWKAFFNNFKHKQLRKNFSNQCYPDCMPNCPGMEKITVEKFNKLYGDVK